MLLLDTTNKSLEIVLAGAVATTELPYVVGYVDISQIDFAMTALREQDGTTRGTTAVAIVPAPAATPAPTSRQLKFLSIYNADTAVATLTIRVKNTATTRIVWKGTLQVGDNLLYLDDTFFVMDSSGSLKTNFSFGDPLQAVHGGTGIAGYAVGDVLYADTTTTLARRADVATGSLFASGGVNAAPAWSASPTLTTSLTTPTVIGGTAVGSSLSLQSTSGVGTTDFIRFLVGNNGATEAVRILDSGFVGIGVVTPLVKFHIVNSESRLQSDSCFYSWYNTAGTRRGYIQNLEGSAFSIVQEQAQGMQFLTNSAIQMTILSGGMVGIGQTNPAGRLSVEATGTDNVIIGRSTNVGPSTNAIFTMVYTSATDQPFAFKNTATNGHVWSMGDGIGVNAGFFGLYDQTAAALRLAVDNTGNIGIGTTTPAALFTVGSGTSSQYQVDSTFKVVKYANVAATGWGHPAIYASGRLAAQTAAVTLTSYTVGAADGSFHISANINVTTSTLHNFTVTCAYTDEANNPQTLTFGFTQLSGATFLTAITNATGAGPYESPVYHLRCKASTSITIATVGGGGFTTVTYNGEGHISQIA
jgi:hypothetical protein